MENVVTLTHFTLFGAKVNTGNFSMACCLKAHSVYNFKFSFVALPKRMIKKKARYHQKSMFYDA